MLRRLLTILCVALTVTHVHADENEAEVRIVGEDGAALFTSDEIIKYDWASHTLTVDSLAAKKLSKDFFTRVVSGAPFQVEVGEEVVYRGTITTQFSSRSFDTPVILIDPARQSAQPTVRLRIQLGYPSEEFFKGQDPRGDERLRTALEKSGKLVSKNESHTAWVAECLREMETIEPGMTRADLLQVYREEGGLSTRQSRRYAYRECPYFKVNVKFEAGGNSESDEESPRDRIKEISQPFLEWAIQD